MRAGLFSVVCDRQTPIELAALLRARSGVHTGHVHARIALPKQTQLGVAYAVLEALGKRPYDRRPPGDDLRAWARAYAWLRGERIHSLSVSGLIDVKPAARPRLLELPEVCDVSVYIIVAREMRPWWGRLAAEWGVVALSDAELLELLPARDVVAMPPPFPVVPVVDAERFRAEALDTLTREEFKRVDAVFAGHFASTMSWRETHRRVTPEDVADLLEATMGDCGSYSEAVTALSGVQAAFRLTNTHSDINIDLSKLARLAGLARADALERGAAERLRWYSNSDCASAGVIRIVSQCSEEDLATLRLVDISPDGTSVRIGDRDYPVSPSAQGILRTQVIDRRTCLATDSDPALVVESVRHTPTPLTTQGARRWLDDITQFADVPVMTDRTSSWKITSSSDLLRELGVQIKEFRRDD